MLKDNSIPHSQIAKEIFSIYPAVTEISLSRGKTIQSLSEEQIKQMKEWMKTRLKIDRVILTVEC